MTAAERDELLRASDVPMTFVARGEGDYVALLPVPGTDTCPLLAASGDCSVWSVRPYNCRRWGCFRPTTDEPFAMAVTKTDDGVMPIRLYQSKPVARQMSRMQRQAQPWALAHGWLPEGED